MISLSRADTRRLTAKRAISPSDVGAVETPEERDSRLVALFTQIEAKLAAILAKQDSMAAIGPNVSAIKAEVSKPKSTGYTFEVIRNSDGYISSIKAIPSKGGN